MGTKVNTSHEIKLKCNQPLTFMNTLLVCLTDLNMLHFAITTQTLQNIVTAISKQIDLSTQWEQK